MEAADFHANLPYPQIRVKEKNMVYAQAMLDNLGGSNSEMSAVSLYFYNHIITGPQYESIAQIFHGIMIVEMHHLDIFAALALQLGEDPRLWTQSQNGMVYWTPGYNKYPTDIKNLLTHALQGELDAISKYQYQAGRIKDPNIVENLQRIIQDEQLHVELFRQMLTQLRQ